MRAVRLSVAAVLGACAASVIVAPSTVRLPFTPTATALYMGGTKHTLTIPDESTEYISGYVNWAYTDFVGPSGLCTGGEPGCAQLAVYTPAEFWPVPNLDAMRFDESVRLGLANLADCLGGVACTVTDAPFVNTVSRPLTDDAYTVFGYSQSATVGSLMKSDLIAHPPAGTVNFVFESNPNRPNGGILERFVGAHIPILGVTFNGATVTNSPQPTPLTTVDAVHQYDPVADFPTNPLNALAMVNALLGFAYEHPEERSGTPLLQGQYQDSTYYLIPTETLPILQPLNAIPYIGPLTAAVNDPPLRVLVESGYDRTINPGAPTPAKYLYFPNPIDLTVNVAKAIPNGWDNGIAYLTDDPGNRPFHTAPQGPYGVGGPPVDAGAIDPYGPPTPSLGVTALPAANAEDAVPEIDSAELGPVNADLPAPKTSSTAIGGTANHTPRRGERTGGADPTAARTRNTA